ncbi:hypothetical protein CPB84DRAFT_1681063 [Gymnopilus junonius]|uniref:FIST domain-containing protein n=1 Tax=Gymnopilus junonius TaxID=109634 RepID=A0A9P5NM45_GYMJU|nr:hypothetical protein CPB84DRAFT_1681063 [Gymnopilus junonius]
MPALHLSTILTRHLSKLLAHITHVSKEYSGKGHTLLFTLSSNFEDPHDLQAVVDKLSKFNGADASERDVGKEKMHMGHTIGCLADSFSSTTFEEPPISRVSNGDSLSCSIGIFDSNLCVPFHSTLPGRTQPQVGRWHSFRKKNEIANPSGAAEDRNNGIDWEAIWNRSSTSTASSIEELLPETLRQVQSSRIKALFSLSAPYPDTLTSVLANTLPNVPSLTLIAAPTHFITGRGVTLFMDGRIFGEGAIGLALLDEPLTVDGNKAEKITCSTDFIGMRRLSGPMTVTRFFASIFNLLTVYYHLSREGNMINELDSSNPTKLLLRSLDLAGISPTSRSQSSTITTTFKDDELFALGIVGPDSQILRTYKITAGDPSSRGGSISLDAPTAPDVGSVVQFLHIPSNSPIKISASFLPGSHSEGARKQVLACVTVPEPSASESVNILTESSESTSHILEGTFLSPSTRGFVLSQPSSKMQSTASSDPGAEEPIEPSRSPWTSSLPGGAASLQLA